MRAAARSANGAAKRAIDKGLDALERILERSPDSEQWIREGIDLRLMGLAVLLPLGEKARTVELLREAKEMAESIGDEARLGRVTSQLGTSLWLSGEHAEALEAGESALKLARSHGRHRLEKSALHNIASVHYARADFDKAIDILGDLTEEFTGDLARQRFGWPSYPSVVFRTFLGASLTLVGDFQRAMTVFEEGLSIANEVEHPYSQTLILEEFGYCLHWMGRRDDALQSLTACMRICDDYDVYTMGSVTAGRLAFVLSENGQPEKGVEYAEAALKNDAHLRAGQIGYHILLFGLATAYLHTKRLTEALDTARLSAKLASDSNERACNAFAHALIGDIELARDAVTEAANEYTIALTIAQKQGMRPLEALCRQKLAEVYHRSSREIEAIQELQIALQTFEALGLPEHRLAAKNALRTLQQESRVAR
jgi:tetratricopeptide (TPR) repeat protein